jgi:methylmalonyl-CoA/ethylmalonyl-CoA epimerase
MKLTKREKRKMSADKEQNLIMKPLHVGVSVPDINASIEWYKNMLGFRLVSDQYIDKLPARIAFLEHGDFSIELFEIEGAAPLPDDRRIPNLDIRTHGNKHVAYAVKDIKALMDTLKEKNVDVAMDIFPMGKDLVSFIRDNAGNLIELIQSTE